MNTNKPEQTQLRSAEEIIKKYIGVTIDHTWAYYNPFLNAMEEYAAQFKEGVEGGQKEGWVPLSEKPPEELDVRIKLIDGSELNVWTQADGDFWYELFDKFITVDRVTHWKPNPPKP